MKLMSKMSCGVIYAAKLNHQADLYKSIAHFMSKYTDTPIEYYTPKMLEKILFNTIAELLNHLTYPSSFWLEYCQWKNYPWEMDDFDAACAALAAIPVKNEKGEYINGFRPFDDFDL